MSDNGHVDPDRAAERKGRVLRNREKIGREVVAVTVVGVLVVLGVFWLIVMWQG
ncbi:hypothetical protein [Nocardioides jensenii]|uniref:hypothetical protein n=1 Tax=Nocardioides jensenii TaxID=1843 RepID=UPI000A841435|nr:hypothetical protein [Nocardioides jensenii]